MCSGTKHQHVRSCRGGVDIQAWKQAHDRLDAYQREQAQKQRQCAPARKPSEHDARLEQLAVLFAAVRRVRVRGRCAESVGRTHSVTQA